MSLRALPLKDFLAMTAPTKTEQYPLKGSIILIVGSAILYKVLIMTR